MDERRRDAEAYLGAPIDESAEVMFHNTTISPHWVALPAHAEYVIGLPDDTAPYYYVAVGPFRGLQEVNRFCRNQLEKELGADASTGPIPGGVVDVFETYMDRPGGDASLMLLRTFEPSRRGDRSSPAGDQYILAGCDEATGPFFGLDEVRQFCREALEEQLDPSESPKDLSEDVIDAYQTQWEAYVIPFRPIPA